MQCYLNVLYKHAAIPVGVFAAEKGKQKGTERVATKVCEEGQRQSKLISLSNCNLACVAGEGKKKRDWKELDHSSFSSPPLPFIALAQAYCNYKKS